MMATQNVSRRWSIVAWTVCAVGVGCLLGGIAFSEVRGGLAQGDEAFLEELLLTAAFVAFPLMGALVAARHSRNAVGWLLLAVGAGIGVLLLASEYAQWALVEGDGDYPLAILAAWFEQWLWLPSIGVIPTLIFLLFPDGRPPSRRWNWLVWVSGGAVALLAIGGMVQQRLVSDGYSLDNPIGIPGLSPVESEPLFAPFFVLYIPLSILCAASLVIRFRRSRGDERQQLKLLTYSGALMVAGIVVGDVLGLPGSLAVSLLLLSASLAVSMLKYRLYDIDRVINRTLVYGAVTAVLLVGYAASVLVIQSVLPIPDDSPVAIAVSTLGMAALFGPLRARIQRVVDRRFYRSKYDAERTVDLFSAQLREESDLESLSRDLLDVVSRTMRPATASLWLRVEQTR